jgi:hypothetical protein
MQAPQRTPEQIERHRDACITHAVKRLLEQGIAPSDHDVMKHAMAIRFGQSRKLGNGGGRRELHELTAKGRTFYPVFDVHMNCVVTYLRAPAEWKGTLNEVGKTLVKQARMCLVAATPYHGD